MGKVATFDEFEIDFELFEVRWRGRSIPVERRVFDVLSYLISHRRRVVSKKELFREIWDGRAVTDASLSVAISAARKVLGDSSKGPKKITTHHGRGYRFALEVVELESELKTSRRGSPHQGFVGRGRELASLSALLELAATGQAQFALVGGEAGIGKTSLAEEFARRARSTGAVSFLGRCKEEAGAPAYWPWVQILRVMLSETTDRQLPTLPAPLEAVLKPVLREPGADGEVPGTSSSIEPTHARFQLFDSLSQVLRSVTASVQVVLVLDDLHRSDRSSLLLLEFILRNLRDCRLLVIGTHRPSETRRSDFHAESFVAMCRETAGRMVPLTGMSLHETSLLVESKTGSAYAAAEIAAIQELTGGNPFFVTQLAPLIRFDESLLRGGRTTELPHTVREAIARQLDTVGTPTREMLNVAAVVGREFSCEVVTAACSLTGEMVTRAVVDAIEAGLISRCGRQRYRFSHALVREVLYQGLDVLRRSDLHARVAQALSDLTWGDPLTHAVELAYHAVEAAEVGEVEQAISCCERAAELASQGIAYEEAIELLRRAIGLLDRHRPLDQVRRCDLLLRLGAEQLRTGDRAEAKLTFERAAAVAERIDASDRLAQAALAAVPGLFAVEAGVRDEFLISLLRRAVELLGDKDLALRARLLARMGVALFWSEETQGSGALSAEAWEIATRCNDARLRLDVLLARWIAEWDPYEVVHRSEIAEEAVRLAQALGDKEALLPALLYRLTGLLEQGAVARFDHEAVVFRNLAEELRQPQGLWYSRLIDAARALHAGRFGEAEASAHEFYEIARRVGDANGFHSYMAQRIITFGERGGRGSVVQTALEARARFPAFIGWRAALSWGLARDGRTAEARREFAALMGAEVGGMPRKMDWPTALVLLADTTRMLREEAAAERLWELLLPFRGRTVVLGLCVMTWGSGARYLGHLAETRRQWREAGELYEQAIAENESADAEPWVAHAEFDSARVSNLAGGRPAVVREFASRALVRAERLGMPLLAGEASALLAKMA